MKFDALSCRGHDCNSYWNMKVLIPEFTNANSTSCSDYFIFLKQPTYYCYDGTHFYVFHFYVPSHTRPKIIFNFHVKFDTILLLALKLEQNRSIGLVCLVISWYDFCLYFSNKTEQLQISMHQHFVRVHLCVSWTDIRLQGMYT